MKIRMIIMLALFSITGSMYAGKFGVSYVKEKAEAAGRSIKTAGKKVGALFDKQKKLNLVFAKQDRTKGILKTQAAERANVNAKSMRENLQELFNAKAVDDNVQGDIFDMLTDLQRNETVLRKAQIENAASENIVKSIRSAYPDERTMPREMRELLTKAQREPLGIRGIRLEELVENYKRSARAFNDSLGQLERAPVKAAIKPVGSPIYEAMPQTPPRIQQITQWRQPLELAGTEGMRPGIAALPQIGAAPIRAKPGKLTTADDLARQEAKRAAQLRGAIPDVGKTQSEIILGPPPSGRPPEPPVSSAIQPGVPGIRPVPEPRPIKLTQDVEDIIPRLTRDRKVYEAGLDAAKKSDNVEKVISYRQLIENLDNKIAELSAPLKTADVYAAELNKITKDIEVKSRELDAITKELRTVPTVPYWVKPSAEAQKVFQQHSNIENEFINLRNKKRDIELRLKAASPNISRQQIVQNINKRIGELRQQAGTELGELISRQKKIAENIKRVRDEINTGKRVGFTQQSKGLLEGLENQGRILDRTIMERSHYYTTEMNAVYERGEQLGLKKKSSPAIIQ